MQETDLHKRRLGHLGTCTSADSGTWEPAQAPTRRKDQWPSAWKRLKEASISAMAASWPTHSAPSTDLPGSRSL